MMGIHMMKCYLGKKVLNTLVNSRLTKPSAICIGNRMDESAIWEKFARQQKNCMRRSRVLYELL